MTAAVSTAEALNAIPLGKLGSIAVFVLVLQGMTLWCFYKIIIELVKGRKGD